MSILWKVPGTQRAGGSTLITHGMTHVNHPEESLTYTCVCVCACVHVCARSCLTLPDPMNCSPPGFSVHGVFQARILEWVAISSSRGSSKPRDQTCISFISCVGRWILYHCATWEALVLVTKSCLTLATPWTIAHQAPLSMGFSR